MKILFVTEFFPTGKDLRFSGGVEARTFFVAKHLAMRHHVSVICSRQKDTKPHERMYGFSIDRLGPDNPYTSGIARMENLFKSIIFIKEAIKFGSTIESDIIDGGNFIGNFIAKQISLKTHKPVVYWYPDVFIGQWFKTTGLIGGITGWFLEKFNLYRSANQFITISKTTLYKLKKANVQSQKLSLIHCGVDLSEFVIKVQKSTPPNIICISRLAHYKNIQDLIFAFTILLKKKLNLKLIIVGQGPEENRLKEICKMLKISRKVSFLNNLPRKQLIKTLKSSHLFCLSSEVEGFGITIIEAAAAGVPYVVSNIGVFKEITKNGQGGLLFKLRDIKDLAFKIEKLLSDKKLYQKKVKEALDLAKNYQWSNIAQKTEKIYTNLLTRQTL